MENKINAPRGILASERWRNVKMLLGSATLILAIAHFALYVGAAKAAELDGAWISNPDACAEVFTVKDGKTSLSTNADFYGSGFVINGSFIRGKIAVCKITSRKLSGKTVQLQASCATDIMISNNKFSLIWIDDNKLTRRFPGIPEMDTTYHRCKM